MAKLDKWARFRNLASRRCNYDAQAKHAWTVAARSAMKDIAADLEVLSGTQTRVNFNPGGIAVSGDIALMAFCPANGRGVHFFGNPDFGYIVRSITSLTDYHGGANRPFSLTTRTRFLLMLLDHLGIVATAGEHSA